MIPADAHARLTKVLEELPPDEVGVYFLLCMTALANTAPEAAIFIMDRVDENLEAADEAIAATTPTPPGGSDD